MNKIYDIDYQTTVEADHPSWVRPFSGGKLKAFFVPSISFGREIIELVQRMDIDFETVTIDKNWDLNKWGIADYYHIRGGIWDFRVAYKNLETALTSDEWFDVLVIPGINGWGYFGEKTLQAIERRVEQGAGLVMIKPFKGEGTGSVETLDRLSPLSPLFNEGFAASNFGGEGFPKVAFDKMIKDKWMPQPHYITSGIPFDVFPYDEMAFYPYQPAGEVIVESAGGMPIAAVRQAGKGRVVALGYYPRDILPQHASLNTEENFYDTIVDAMPGAKHKLGFNYLEYFYSLVYRSMIWSAGREPKRRIAGAEACQEGLKVHSSDENGGTFAYRVCDDWGNTVYENSVEGISLPLPEWLSLGGRYRADIFMKHNDVIIDWYTYILVNNNTIGITDVALQSTLVRPGECLKAAIAVEGLGGTVDIQVVDDYARVLYSERHETFGDAQLDLNWTVRDVFSIQVRVRALAYADGHLVDCKDSPSLLVPPAERKLKDLEIFMNSHNKGQGDFWDLQRARSLEFGVTGAFPGSTKVLAMSGAEGLGIYWYYRFPYVERKETYLETLDKKHLHRVPCLSDPDFWRRMEQKMLPILEKSSRYNPVSYYANDEGSLTCYTNELDLCFCPHCMQEFRRWLMPVYGSLDALNAEWGTAFACWDDVVPYTFEEAEKAQEFASWGDHRRFMEHSFAGSYEKIAGIIRRVDPEGVIRMSGSQQSTPHTGYDYWMLHRHIGYFEAYGAGNQFELHRSFARPDTIVGGWFGYGGRGVGIKHSLWYAMLHGLTLISVFFEHSIINPDYTYFSGALDMRDVFYELRRGGIGKLLVHTATRNNCGIAVHYSMASVHGSYARHDFRRYNQAREAWLSMLEALGWQYDMVATQQIEEGALLSGGFKVLVLPYSIALGGKETEEILKFAENGGAVIADMQTGIMDEHCKLLSAGALDGLFGIRRLNHKTRPFSGDDSVHANREFAITTLTEEKLMDQEFEFPFAESGVRLDAGQAAFVDDFMCKIPVVTVNPHGGGRGIYLNCDFSCFTGRNPDDPSFVKSTLDKLLNLAGAQKPVKLLTAAGSAVTEGYETVCYSDGEASYTALLRDMSSKGKVAYDGRVVSGGGLQEDDSERIAVEFAKPGHVYDVRKKRYLGHTDRIDAAVAAGDSVVFSVLPYEVTGISIDAPAAAARGSEIRFDVSVLSGKPEGAYSNVLSFSFFGPDGKYRWIYSENAAIPGLQCVKTCAIPFNEDAGVWEMTVTDAATGVTARKNFTVG